MNLFADQEADALRRVQPLAVRMRPRNLAEFVGQDHFVGPGKLLRRLIQSNRLTSAIFHGPPGCGKTTLARVIAAETRAEFRELHAAEASVKDVRAIIDEARTRVLTGRGRTILFLDEIHRFNRAQQDTLLKDVEEGVLTLIGATTENPYFAVNGPLISRGNVFRFEPLSADQLRGLLRAALADRERGLGSMAVACDDAALDALIEFADGDARRALNGLEIAVRSIAEGESSSAGGPRRVTREIAIESLQRKAQNYDDTGDSHYDMASALIKSMRGSDPDAALYWLARMLEGGEDPRFLARRIVICASEDVGTADSLALVVANAAAQATEFIGLPECEYALAHATIYVACAPKSNAVTRAIKAAREEARGGAALPVPPHLRDKSYAGAKQLGHGRGYLYPHDYPEGFVVQDYLGADREYYQPTNRGGEARIAERLERWRGLRAAANEQAAGTRAPIDCEPPPARQPTIATEIVK